MLALLGVCLAATPVAVRLLTTEGLRNPARRSSPTMVLAGARLSVAIGACEQACEAWECASYHFPTQIDMAEARYRAARCRERRFQVQAASLSS